MQGTNRKKQTLARRRSRNEQTEAETRWKEQTEQPWQEDELVAK